MVDPDHVRLFAAGGRGDRPESETPQRLHEPIDVVAVVVGVEGDPEPARSTAADDRGLRSETFRGHPRIVIGVPQGHDVGRRRWIAQWPEGEPSLLRLRTWRATLSNMPRHMRPSWRSAGQTRFGPEPGAGVGCSWPRPAGSWERSSRCRVSSCRSLGRKRGGRPGRRIPSGHRDRNGTGPGIGRWVIGLLCATVANAAAHPRGRDRRAIYYRSGRPGLRDELDRSWAVERCGGDGRALGRRGRDHHRHVRSHPTDGAAGHDATTRSGTAGTWPIDDPEPCLWSSAPVMASRHVARPHGLSRPDPSSPQQLVHPVRTEPPGHHHEERPAVVAAEHARVAGAVELEPIEHLTALADTEANSLRRPVRRRCTTRRHRRRGRSRRP